jgi:hypothetical protein
MKQAMRIMGKQFVLGRTIEEALGIAKSLEAEGYRFSYDMLGRRRLRPMMRGNILLPKAALKSWVLKRQAPMFCAAVDFGEAVSAASALRCETGDAVHMELLPQIIELACCQISECRPHH